MFTKQKEQTEEKVIKDSTVLRLHPTQFIPTGGYVIDTPTFGGFVNPSQIIIHMGQPYRYFVEEGQTISLYEYGNLSPIEFVVKELHFAKNEIVLERVSKYNF
ncbi:hypothetical protein PP175_25710 (plasmid) [Aneurinibacillus sp. Ricciae_BoGa-3]|uniref:hypothetical protein n=1 Tax=Aneurinibacillus sp. Ricciae_BoGa-3 TaxID=3022697 RepID=UPI002341A3C8|nr:hypothetical protein [Aneurinibacillus sp. Ricciae_BoGa-3]WCK57466.1 hypothetical protein PP175_25710 [Aneurinibacillus sp. Ricciae_BoGa-3]